MNIFQFLFKRKKKPGLSINIFGKDYPIDMSKEAMKRRKAELEIDIKNEWVNNKSEDNFVTNPERKLVGFYGIKSFSENNEYCGVYIYAGNPEQAGHLALVDTHLKSLCFKKELMRPHACFVSNSGIVAIVDWLSWGKRCGKFCLYNKQGEEIFSIEVDTNLKDQCLITPDNNYATFESPGYLFVVDISMKRIIHKYSLDYVQKVTYDFEKMNIIMKTNTDGKKVRKIS